MIILLYIVLALSYTLLSAMAIYNMKLSLFSWTDPEIVANNGFPEKYSEPNKTFSILVPALHEEKVISKTISALAESNYPKDKFEILVLLRDHDLGTIKAAFKTIAANKYENVRIVIYNGTTSGKPAQLNQGLDESVNEICLIIDAEDDVSPDLLAIANTRFSNDDIDVLQGGVQLMDFNSHWYGTHTVLEYYFWFRSRMHYHAREGMVPLGGNTVFFKMDALRDAKGWDESCLTEDGDIGIRLSSLHKKFGVFYEAKHVTKEEIPDSTHNYIKQRTRWIQGFMQILKKKEWQALPTRKQRFLALYVLTQPLVQAFTLALTPLFVWTMFYVKLPILLSLFSFVPFATVMLSIGVLLLGLYDFGREQNVKIRLRDYLILVASFAPYQLLLGISSVRALYREIRGNLAWEKTAHHGTHRLQVEGAAGEAA